MSIKAKIEQEFDRLAESDRIWKMECDLRVLIDQLFTSYPACFALTVMAASRVGS